MYQDLLLDKRTPVQANTANYIKLTGKLTKIKCVLFVLTLLYCGTNTAYSQKLISTYSLSYFDQKYDIEAAENKNDKFSVYIGVSAERKSTKAAINVESTDLDEFNKFLLDVKNKYVEWIKVAKENNVKEMSKDMDFKSPATTICWQSSKWWFSFGHRLQPKFLILDNGKMVVSIYKKVTASSNEYIDEKIYWVFSEPQEIEDLVSQLDPQKISSKLKEKEKVKDLFN